MNLKTIPLAELTPAQASRWSSHLEQRPELLGPCFRPEFFQAVGRHVPEAAVAIWEIGSEQAFLPYFRAADEPVALPIPMCDYQFVAAPRGVSWDSREWLEASGLAAWDFDHLVGAEGVGGKTRYGRDETSLRITLRGPMSGYLDDLKKRGTTLRNLGVKQRKLERDHGPLRFTALSTDESALDHILEWKADRFLGGRAPFDARAVLGALARTNGSIEGCLSTLHAGPSLVSAHFGLRSRGVLYYWFPAFNPAFGKYTPGWLMVQELVAHLPDFECRILDFGPGGEGYKSYFANDGLPCLSGSYELNTPFTLWRRLQRNAAERVRSIGWLHDSIRPVVRGCRRWFRRDAA